MKDVSVRVRWAIFGGVLVIVVILVLLSVREPGPRTWVVQPGQTLTLSADDVGPDDLYRCPGKGGVKGTPEPGHLVGNL